MRLARTTDWESRGKDKQFSSLISHIWSQAALAERELEQAVNDLGVQDDWGPNEEKERTGCDCCDPTSPSPDPVVVRLEAEVEELRKERDEAREAARWLFYDDNLHEPEEDVLERWPWLEESP